MKKCENTCIFQRMLSKCGNVIQQWQKYIPKAKPLNTTHGVKLCLQNIIVDELDSLSCNCPVGCQEMHMETETSMEPCSEGSSVKFSYQSNTYTEIVEVPAYPASKFITDIGGWLSLFSGMSALSLLEVVIFIPLAIIAYYKRSMAR